MTIHSGRPSRSDSTSVTGSGTRSDTKSGIRSVPDLVPSTKCLVPSTKCLAPSNLYQIPSTKCLALGTKYQALSTEYQVLGKNVKNNEAVATLPTVFLTRWAAPGRTLRGHLGTCGIQRTPFGGHCPSDGKLCGIAVEPHGSYLHPAWQHPVQ